ncbi:hypothetical protein [Bacillus sp. CECT 9360]|uniref:hypothetical protein n=1 Tax=Bacillus sp. CECT 9360 TaxID=2845821 RepID=UPI001E403DC4|nr:hypothetical protein [Bacillus sp. CECT 9360]CAH0344744.1 hypothetical protein BCI9360_01010 [Bacillus sp. CECT 9360]
MKKKVKIYPLLLLAMVLVPVAYFESDYVKTLYDTEPILLGQAGGAINETTMATPGEKKNASEENLILQLDQRLVDREEVDGYLVETYREYELYEDREGNVKKVIPTSNYDYIRYKLDE